MIDRHRGEVWLAEFRRPDKTRPIVLISRDEAYSRRRLVAYAPITTRVRRLPTHISVADAGIPGLRGVVNCDSLGTVDQGRLLDRLGELPTWKVGELDAALKLALGLD